MFYGSAHRRDDFFAHDDIIDGDTPAKMIDSCSDSSRDYDDDDNVGIGSGGESGFHSAIGDGDELLNHKEAWLLGPCGVLTEFMTRYVYLFIYGSATLLVCLVIFCLRSSGGSVFLPLSICQYQTHDHFEKNFPFFLHSLKRLFCIFQKQDTPRRRTRMSICF